MPRALSEAVGAFLSNLIEVGVCDEPSCGNAFFHLPDNFMEVIDELAQHTEPPSPRSSCFTAPILPLPDHLMQQAVAAKGDAPFPVGAVGRHLTSSFTQLQPSLVTYVDSLFTALSRRLDARLETLFDGLCMLERVHRANVLSLQRHRVVRGESAGGSDADRLPTPRPSVCPGSSGGSPVPHGKPACPPSPASTITTVGPHTIDADSHTTAAEGGAPMSFSMLPPPAKEAPCEDPEKQLEEVTGGAGTVAHDVEEEVGEETLPFSHRSCCSACAGGEVYGLQYYSVHVLLSACLLLSIRANEASRFDDEFTLLPAVAAASGCTVETLRLAERLVCETLQFDLSVSEAAMNSLLWRLGIVEVTTAEQ